MKPRLLAFVGAVIVGAAFILLVTRWPLTADTFGYEYAAKQLIRGNGLGYDDPNNALFGEFFSPFAFQITHFADARTYLGYPPGFPLLLALPGFITGIEASVHYVVPVLAGIGVMLTFLWGKWVSQNEWVGLMAAGMVALTPNYWLFGTEAWSEIPSMVFVLAGYLLYFYSQRDTATKKEAWLYAALGGIVLVFSLFIRYTNITFIASVGLAELLTRPRALIRPSQKWAFYAVLAFGLLLILLFNHFYYGGVRLTSYSPENGWYLFPPFSLAYALGESPVDGFSLIEAGKTLWGNFSVVLLFVPVGWFGLPRFYRWLFVLVVVSSLSLYSIYAFAPAGINSRFLLPLFPFLAILGVQGINFFLQKSPKRWPQAVLLGGLVLWLGWNLWPQVNELRTKNQGAETVVTNLRTWLAETEEDAVLMSYELNDQIAYYGNRSVLNYRRIPQYDPEQEKYRYDLFEPCLVYLVDSLLLAGKPVYFHEDRSPTLYNAKERLEAHYALVPFREEPKLFRVTNDSLTAVRQSPKICTP